MKHVTILLAVMMLTIVSCRTTSVRSHSFTKAEISGCDSRGLIKALGTGGLFGTRGVIYNQAHVIPGVIHPLMKEKEATGSLGLYHAYEPKESVESVATAMSDIALLSTKVQAAEPRMPSSQAAVFEGLDKTLNVFSVDGAKLLKVTSLKVDVPPDASAIIIIKGQTPALTAAKLESPINPAKTLFVLPDAISFTVRGDRFAGTVIAPNAQIHLDAKHEGSLYGANVRAMMISKPLMYTGCMFASDQFQK
jgi:hypothetical protein